MFENAQDLVASISLSTDLALIAIAALVVVYALLLGHTKIRMLALSVYVGIVLAGELGAFVGSYVSGFSEGTIKLALLALPIFILELGRRGGHKRGEHTGTLMTATLAVVTACLIIASGLHVLGEETRRNILDGSTLATLVYTTRLWWIAGVPLAVLGESFIRMREH